MKYGHTKVVFHVRTCNANIEICMSGIYTSSLQKNKYIKDISGFIDFYMAKNITLDWC